MLQTADALPFLAPQPRDDGAHSRQMPADGTATNGRPMAADVMATDGRPMAADVMATDGRAMSTSRASTMTPMERARMLQSPTAL